MRVSLSPFSAAHPRRSLHKFLALLRPIAPLTVRQFYYVVAGVAATFAVVFLLASTLLEWSFERAQNRKTGSEIEILAEQLRSMGGQNLAKRVSDSLLLFERTHLGTRLFLLTDRGVVVSPAPVVADRSALFVRMETVKRAVATGTTAPAMGEDPQSMNIDVPIFSVPVTIDSSLRYLYVVSDASAASSGFFSYEDMPIVIFLFIAIFTFAAVGGALLYFALHKMRTISLAVAGISHDIRGPLTSIQARLEDLAEHSVPPFKTAAILAFKDTNALGRMVNDLHELSLQEARGAVVVKEDLSISELLSDAIASVSGRAADRGISILAEVSPKLPHVNGAISLLDRMIRNLLENSLRYTPANGKIFVHASALERSVRVIVSDTGVGIDEKDLQHAGKKFWRGPLTASKTDGTGLGLFIARRIAQLHGSSLRIVSTKGDGTAVFFDIPTSTRIR